MNENLLVSYCFMSSLLNNKKNLYEAVYLPIFQYGLAELVEEIKDKGNLNPIKGSVEQILDKIYEVFGIRIPVVVGLKLLMTVNNRLSKRKKQKYSFIVDQSRFQCNEYEFKDKREEYDNARRDANKLEDSFREYLKNASYEDLNQIPTFADFMAKKAFAVSAFLYNREFKEEDVETSYLPHANFLKEIEDKDAQLFKIARNLYTGSMIAVFLEYSSTTQLTTPQRIVYYLDTQVVLEALDLQEQEKTRPAEELLKLIRQSGGIPRILDVTYIELQNVIDNAIKGKEDSLIITAYKRTGKNRTDLTRLRSRLNEVLKSKGIDVQSIEQRLKEGYAQSEDVEELKKTRFHTKNAIHDVIAYLYIRQSRGDKCYSINEIDYWFVSANSYLYDFNNKRANGHVSEIIMPDVLTAMLFYKNPECAAEASQIGLNLLISRTLYEESPDNELIEEFGNIVRKERNIDEEAFNDIMSVASETSAKKLHRLIDDVKEDPASFRVGFNKIKTFAQDKNKRLEQAEAKVMAGEKKTADEQQKNIILSRQNQRLKKIICTFLIIFAYMALFLWPDFRRCIFILTIRSVITWVFLVLLLGVPWFWKSYRKCGNWIIGLSGLWGFGNFMLNVIKALSQK